MFLLLQFSSLSTDSRDFLHLCTYAFTLLYSNKQPIARSISAGLHVYVTYIYRIVLGILDLGSYSWFLSSSDLSLYATDSRFINSLVKFSRLPEQTYSILSNFTAILPTTNFWFCKHLLSSGYTKNNDLDLEITRLYFTRTQNNCLPIWLVSDYSLLARFPQEPKWLSGLRSLRKKPLVK